MMILKKLCYGLSGSLFLASSLFTIPSHAATDSIGLTVTTDVEMGTCTSTLTVRRTRWIFPTPHVTGGDGVKYRVHHAFDDVAGKW